MNSAISIDDVFDYSASCVDIVTITDAKKLCGVHGEKHPSVATAFSNIASVLRKQGQLDEALEMHEKALKIKRRALGEDHVHVAKSLEGLGCVYDDQGKFAEAMEMYGKALATYDRALGVDNMDSADVYHNIAITKKRSGDVAGALESAREPVRIYTKLGINSQTSQDAANLVKELEARSMR